MVKRIGETKHEAGIRIKNDKEVDYNKTTCKVQALEVLPFLQYEKLNYNYKWDVLYFSRKQHKNTFKVNPAQKSSFIKCNFTSSLIK